MNLKKYSDIMGPAKSELIEKGISPAGIPRINF